MAPRLMPSEGSIVTYRGKSKKKKDTYNLAQAQRMTEELARGKATLIRLSKLFYLTYVV